MGKGKSENNAFDHINDLHANTSIKNRANFSCICPEGRLSDQLAGWQLATFVLV